MTFFYVSNEFSKFQSPWGVNFQCVRLHTLACVHPLVSTFNCTSPHLTPQLSHFISVRASAVISYSSIYYHLYSHLMQAKDPFMENGIEYLSFLSRVKFRYAITAVTQVSKSQHIIDWEFFSPRDVCVCGFVFRLSFWILCKWKMISPILHC